MGLRFLNLPVLLCFLLQMLTGFYVQYSASGGELIPFLAHQAVVVLVVGGIAFFCTISISTDTLSNQAYKIYVISILLLLTTTVLGKTSMGATRWIQIMGISFQPTEIMKLAVILNFARYFASDIYRLHSDYFLVKPFLHMIPVILIVLKQPSLGTAVFLLLEVFYIYYAVGVRHSFFLKVLLVLFLTVPLVWTYYIKDYQKNRIITFLKPGTDKQSKGYNILQSQIAIGSGGLFGKGLLSGTQNRLKFLPERRTDFAIAVVAEELGFLGISVLILSYVVIFVSAIKIAANSRSVFCKLSSSGIGWMIFLHFLINLSMTVGLLPVVGMPLPLISYGGSSSLSCMIGIAILLKIDRESKIERARERALLIGLSKQ